MNRTDTKQILNLEKPDLRLTTNIDHEQTTTSSFNFLSLEQTKIKKTKKITTAANTKISEHNNRSVTDARIQPSSMEKSSTRHNMNTEEKHSRNTVAKPNRSGRAKKA